MSIGALHWSPRFISLWLHSSPDETHTMKCCEVLLLFGVRCGSCSGPQITFDRISAGSGLGYDMNEQ
ncbi:hypothetical protein SRHO_G00139450 [Serrasalmus rhombeus]